MKFSIPQPDLLAAINRVRSVVEARNTIPVLGFLKLEANGGELAITATDMGVLATSKTPAAIESDGAALVESAKLYDFVRNIPADREIIVETSEHAATIKAGRSRAELATLPVDQFPLPNRDVGGDAFVLSADDVRHVLFGPLSAVSDEEIRYYLCGVYLHTADGELRGAATDGHVLIKRVVDAPAVCELTSGVIIPSKALATLQKCLNDEDLEVSVGEAAIRFEAPSFIIRSNLINGTFPDYERVIPPERENPITVDRAEASNVITRVASVTVDHLKTVIFEHDAEGILVRTPAAAIDEARDIIAAKTNGEFPLTAFSVRQMAKLLGSIEGEQVVFHFNDTAAPHVFIDPAHSRDLRVLMPVRDR